MNEADRLVNLAMLTSFARKVAELPPDAWDRVAARCGSLDQRTVDGFLGRAELVGRSFVPDTDTYQHPFVHSAVGAWGTLCGLALETTHALSPSGSVRFEHAAGSWLPPGAPLSKPLSDALSRLAAVANAQRPSHPGIAAALFAVGLVFIARRTIAPTSIAAIYRPFESEIPYASLSQGSQEHAA